jgi:hypothetical protein
MNESRYFRVWTCAALLCAAPALSADATLPKDLKATIVLQGQPCAQVVSSKRNSDSDYTVTCKDGGRYHVFVDSNGRVVVAKQGA